MRLSFDEVTGRSGLLAPEKRPVGLMNEVINWEYSEELGNLTKRRPYLTLRNNDYKVNRAIEWTDIDGNNGIIIEQEISGTKYVRFMERDTLTYDAPAALDYDVRTAGSTINQTNPVQISGEIRSGAGLNAATDRPFIAMRIRDRQRYYNPATGVYDSTIPAGTYLDDMIYDEHLRLLIPQSSGGGLIGGPGGNSLVEDKGFAKTDIRRVKILAAPVIDGYQRSFPDPDIAGFVADDIPTNNRYTFTFYLEIKNADKLKSPRITDIDVFLSITGEGADQERTQPYYYLTRIPMDGVLTQHFFEGQMTVTSTYVEIDNYTSWFTFDNLLRAYVYNVTDDEWIQVNCDTGVTYNGTNVRFAVTSGTPTNTGSSKKFKMYLGWHIDSTNPRFAFFYDDFHQRLGSEMYDYLGIPKGDLGRTDKRFKYIAHNGTRTLIAGTDDTGLYYSTPRDPDNFPIRNRVKSKYYPVALEAMREDFIIASKQRMERLQIYGEDGNIRLDSDYSDRGAVSQKALLKIHENLIVGCDYRGPWLLTNQGLEDIGGHLNDYFDPRDGLLTDAEKDQCVIGYNKHLEQIWFSFPTYNDGTDYFGSGVIFSYDVKARRMALTSPWFLVSTQKKLYTLVTNEINHLIAFDQDGTYSDVLDYNGAAGDEEMFSKIEFMTLENPLVNNQILWKLIRFNISGSDTYYAYIYVDGEASPSKTLAVSSLGKVRPFVAGRVLRVQLVVGESSNTGTFSGMDIHGNPKVL